MIPLILTFQAPTRPLSINESNGMHWAARTRRLKPWRTLTHYAYKHTDMEDREDVQGKPVRIEIIIPFPKKARRDPHNYTGTIVKAIIDELVICGLVPDDNADWLTVGEPKLVVGDYPVEIHIYPK